MITAEVAPNLLQQLALGQSPRTAGRHFGGPTVHHNQLLRRVNSRTTDLLDPSRLTSCPIPRTDSNFDMPTYAEHPSLQRIKTVPSPVLSLSRTLILTSASPYLPTYAGDSHWCILCGSLVVRSGDRSNVGLRCFSPHVFAIQGRGLWAPHRRHVCDTILVCEWTFS